MSLMTGWLLTQWRKYREVITYLMVGGWNTLFGITFYALAIHFFWPRFHYLVIGVVCSVIGITNAFIGYKLFVFRTKGTAWNILCEYARFYLVYFASGLIQMLPLWLFVDMFGIQPAWANVWVTLIATIISYLGHKFFTFRRFSTSHT